MKSETEIKCALQAARVEKERLAVAEHEDWKRAIAEDRNAAHEGGKQLLPCDGPAVQWHEARYDALRATWTGRIEALEAVLEITQAQWWPVARRTR